MTQPASLRSDDRAWVAYFAYGSNMDPATLRDRRGIAYRRAVAARAGGWRLAVDKPSLLGNGEAVATIVRDDAAEVLGVLYEIDPRDVEHLDLTEGVLLGHYERVTLEVTPLAEALAGDDGYGGGAVLAFAYASARRDASLVPSRRYRDLLLAGANHHGLPGHWIRLLEQLPVAEEGADGESLRRLVDAALRRPE